MCLRGNRIVLALLVALEPFVARAGWPTIVYPSEAGITWVAGQTYTIEWTSVHIDPVPIYLIKVLRADPYTVDLVKIISSGYPNPDSSGTISWTVPANIRSGSSYAIQVGRIGQAVAFSDNPFTISGGGPPPPPPRKTAKVIVEANPSYGATPLGAGTFDVGSQQQISASPASCFVFTGWTDGNTDNPRTITVPSGGATYTANFLNILKDSVAKIPTALAQQMGAHFVPANGKVTLEQAKQICGVHHFNWIQHITYVPNHWKVTSGLYGEPLLFGEVLIPPILDPIATSNKDYYYKVRSSRLSLLDPPLTFNHNDPECPDCPVFDDEEFYLNEPVGPSGSSGRETSGSLLFSDTPMYALQYLDPNDTQDYVQFETRLIGVYPDGTSISWKGIGTNFRWKSNTRCTEERVVKNGEVSVIGFFDSLDTTNALKVISGSVFDVSVDSPSPLTKPGLQMNVNFAAGKMDQAKLTGTFELPLGFPLTNRHAVVTVGGVSVDFITDVKGKGASGLSRLKLTSKNGIAYLTATLKGDWNATWVAAGLSNDTVKNKLVTMPVLLTFDTNPPLSFGEDVSLRYTAAAGKLGRAKYKAN